MLEWATRYNPSDETDAGKGESDDEAKSTTKKIKEPAVLTREASTIIHHRSKLRNTQDHKDAVSKMWNTRTSP